MASKRRLRRRSCEGKVRHCEEQQAAAAAKRLRKVTGNYRIGWYRCRFCKGWHIGRRGRKRWLKIRAMLGRD